MKIEIITLFPEMFEGPFSSSIIKRAREKGLVEIKIHNLRNWALNDKHQTVDDKPFGGGAGMVIRVDVVDKAISSLKKDGTKTILLDAGGKTFNQEMAKKLSREKHLIIICGHYEGFDYRVHKLVDEVISIGDFILTGGEIAAMAIVDSVTRLVPNVLSKKESKEIESFMNFKGRKILEYPQYTRPRIYKGLKVPKVLLSGNHKEIEKWRIKKAIERTKSKRPDLLKNHFI